MAPQLQRLLRVVGHRDHVHGDVARPRVALELVEHAEARVVGQVHVEHDRARPVVRRPRRGPRRPCARPRTGSPARARGRAGCAAKRDVVLDHQDAPLRRRSAGRGRRATVGPAGAAGGARARGAAGGAAAAAARRGSGRAGAPASRRVPASTRQRQREGAARPGRALDRDVAAEQARQVARDRQAEAGAAVLAVRAAVRLAEGLEDHVAAGRRGCRCRCRARRRRRTPAPRRRPRSDTSPRSVNLNAFDSRFFRIWPSRCASVSMRSGVPASTAAREREPLLRAPCGSKALAPAPSTRPRSARAPATARACRPRSSTGRGCR